MTHSIALLEISQKAWGEIAEKLREAGYDHAFVTDGVIDMHGIGIKAGKETEPTHCQQCSCE
jgi:hypothetical protein